MIRCSLSVRSHFPTIWLLGFSSLLYQPNFAIAARDIKVSEKVTEKRSEEQTSTAFSLLAGLGGGFQLVDAPDLSTYFNMKGYLIQGSITGSLRTRRFVLDLTAAWRMSRVEGAAQVTPDASLTSATSKNVDAAVLNTRIGLFQISPKYRFNRLFEMGPTAAFQFGSLSPYGQFQKIENFPITVGLAASLGLATESFHWRALVHLERNLTPLTRAVYSAILGVEVGFPFILGRTIERQVVRTEVQTEEKIVEKVVEKEKIVEVEKEKIVEKKILQFVFDEELIHFDTDRAELKPQAKKFLKELGEFLLAQADGWERVEIEGHTDQRGSEEHNQSLSEGRVASVKAELIAAGVSPEKLKTQAFGEKRPLDPREISEAWAVNRRVEMHFEGVKDPQIFGDGVNRIRARNRVHAGSR
jgi:outer membrane protein OmpA-like peptidoglycan-associated protein